MIIYKRLRKESIWPESTFKKSDRNLVHGGFWDEESRSLIIFIQFENFTPTACSSTDKSRLRGPHRQRTSPSAMVRPFIFLFCPCHAQPNNMALFSSIFIHDYICSWNDDSGCWRQKVLVTSFWCWRRIISPISRRWHQLKKWSPT